MKSRTHLNVVMSALISILVFSHHQAFAAQYRTTPTYDGGSRTTDDNGNTYRTKPTYDGGSRTTDDNGNTCRTKPTYDGGSRTTCD